MVYKEAFVMYSILILTISGSEFFFTDNGFSLSQKGRLTDLAKDAFDIQPELKGKTDNDICNWFIGAAEKELSIKLDRIRVSHIVRINAQ